MRKSWGSWCLCVHVVQSVCKGSGRRSWSLVGCYLLSHGIIPWKGKSSWAFSLPRPSLCTRAIASSTHSRATNRRILTLSSECPKFKKIDFAVLIVPPSSINKATFQPHQENLAATTAINAQHVSLVQRCIAHASTVTMSPLLLSAKAPLGFLQHSFPACLYCARSQH